MTIFSSKNSTACSTSPPRTATLSFCIPNSSAKRSVYPSIFPPPPTTKTALTDFPPFNSFILSATPTAIDCITGSNTSSSSSLTMLCCSPIISLYVTSFINPASFFICSAVPKSTRQCFAIVSVKASPAIGSIPNAIMLPSFVMEISEVPAPTSTKAIFSILYISGMATWIAAIGSNVILAT